MKKLITILGPNGIGKSTTAKMFVELYTNTAYVDAEWCRYMNPFAFTQENKQVVIENIFCLLHNYFSCSNVDTVIFPYGWHGERKLIHERVIEKLIKNGIDFQEHIVVLKCSKEENIKREKNDGRDEDRIKRSIENTFDFYNGLDYPCIDTTNMTPSEVAKAIKTLIS